MPRLINIIRYIQYSCTGLGPQQRNFYSQKSRQGCKSSAVQLSHAPLIGTQEIFKQQPALEEHGTVQFQPHTACKWRTVAQAARPAAEPCLDDARTKAAQPSSPAQRVAAPARADPKKHDVPTQTARRAPHRPSCSPPLLCHMDGRSRGSMRHSFARHSSVPWPFSFKPSAVDAASRRQHGTCHPAMRRDDAERLRGPRNSYIPQTAQPCKYLYVFGTHCYWARV